VEAGMVTRFREKPTSDTLPEHGDVLVNMGVYVFSRRALLDIADSANPMETDFGCDILPRLVRGQRVAAYDFSASPRTYWRDVGSLDSYFRANMDLLGPSPEFHPEGDPEWPVYALGDSSTLKSSDSRISRQAVVERSTIRRSVVSHGVCIEQGALVENSVILPGARVGRNARLRNTILAEGASIPAGFKVGLNLSLDRSRFMVTPRGVVVIHAPLRRTYERTAPASARPLAEAVA
jgi:glucose-1-phosphate adenylyltransferase